MSRNIIRFSRHLRKSPKWDVGTPLGGRRLKPRRQRRSRRSPLNNALRVLFLGVAGLAATVLIGDHFVGWLKADSTCRISHIVDGDTVGLMCAGGGGGRARLMDYDTPEIQARCGRERWGAFMGSMALRQALWQAGRIRISRHGSDRYGRILARVSLDGRPLAGMMVESGWARPYAGGRRGSWCDSSG